MINTYNQTHYKESRDTFHENNLSALQCHERKTTFAAA